MTRSECTRIVKQFGETLCACGPPRKVQDLYFDIVVEQVRKAIEYNVMKDIFLRQLYSKGQTTGVEIGDIELYESYEDDGSGMCLVNAFIVIRVSVGREGLMCASCAVGYGTSHNNAYVKCTAETGSAFM